MRSEILRRFVFKDKKEDILHTSGYATAQNKARMGAASTESFEKRRKIDQNRKLVRGYSDSKMINDIGRQTSRLRIGLKKDLQKREERFGPKDKKSDSFQPHKGNSRTGASKAVRPEVKRASMPRKNPGIFR